MDSSRLVRPTPEQALWADLEVGVIIHLDMPIFRNGYDLRQHWGDVLPPSLFYPKHLNTDQWVKAAYDAGARYAVLVAKHGTGFCLWPTDVHDYSIKSTPWKDGHGDIVGDFFRSCQKYGLRPGLYYSASCNQWANVDNPGRVREGGEEAQKRYNDMVLRQLAELWTRYGDIFEIWFDGGCLPPEDGGPDIASLLHKLQPKAVVFQGPKETRSLIRWCGNERAEAAENCSAIYNFSLCDDDGTVEREDTGNTFGNVWCPAECDTPNRDPKCSYAGGWLWAEGQEDAVFSSEELFSRYLSSVGRNGNLLLGMVIDTDGRFPKADTKEFAAFGKKVHRIFDAPLVDAFTQTSERSYTLTLPENAGKAGYVALGENIREGERITGYTVTAFNRNGQAVFSYDGQIISHKRILAVPETTASVRFTVTSSKAPPLLTQFALYRK